MIRRLRFPLFAFALLAIVEAASPVPAHAGDIEIMHCNHKVCQDAIGPNLCDSAVNGPDTHCIWYSIFNCAWDLCGGTEN